MSRLVPLVLTLFCAACATTPLYPPEYAACYERARQHSVELLPAYEALGYHPEIHLQLDEEMRDGRGFRQPHSIMGDAVPGGRIRLRPSQACVSDAITRAVLAHEIAHVALQHRGVPGDGIVLEWEKKSHQEIEADELALKALRTAGGYTQAARFIECRHINCFSEEGGARAKRALRH